MPTVTANSFEKRPGGCAPLGVVMPVLAACGGRAAQSPPRDLEQPTATATSKADTVLVTAYGIPRYGEAPGQEPRARSVEAPAATVVPTGNGDQLVAATIVQNNAGFYEGHGRDPRQPVSTILGSGSHQSVAAAYLSHFYSSNTNGGEGDPEKPLKTVTAEGFHASAVMAFITKYYGAGEGQNQAAGDPLHTVTALARFGLIMVLGELRRIVDIGMRMLTPRELFLAQGFPPDYIIDVQVKKVVVTKAGIKTVLKWLTKSSQVRMCGNSVCPPLASALAGANVPELARVREAA